MIIYLKKIIPLFIIAGSILFYSGCSQLDPDGEFVNTDQTDDTENIDNSLNTINQEIQSDIDADADSDLDTETDEDTEPTRDDIIAAEKIPGNCMVPDRIEYMESFGVTKSDTDLDDPNVIAGKEHTILFIFDRSGSMASPWNEDGGSKWDIAKETMIAAVTPFKKYLSAGALFFSLNDGEDVVAKIDSGQQIDYSIGEDFLTTWEENMGMYAASGGTPLMSALESANDAIATACENGILEKPFKVIIISDGMPDYYDPLRALGLVKMWYEMGIQTTVVGMPGSADATKLLDDIALVGSGQEATIYTNESSTEDFQDYMTIACD